MSLKFWFAAIVLFGFASAATAAPKKKQMKFEIAPLAEMVGTPPAAEATPNAQDMIRQLEALKTRYAGCSEVKGVDMVIDRISNLPPESSAKLDPKMVEAVEQRLAAECTAAPVAKTARTPVPSGSAGFHVTQGRMAVLELNGTLSQDERSVLSDEVRGAVVNTLGKSVQVMTRENMEVMLADMGLDSDCVAEGACEVETARNLGVDYVISGKVVKMGDKMVVSVKLHEVRNGQLLSTTNVKGSDSLELLDVIGPASSDLLKIKTN